MVIRYGYQRQMGTQHTVIRMGLLPDDAKWSRTGSRQTIENNMPMQATELF
jgi:hypothetical protein